MHVSCVSGNPCQPKNIVSVNKHKVRGKQADCFPTAFPLLSYCFPTAFLCFPMLSHCFPMLSYAFTLLAYAFPLLSCAFPLLSCAFLSKKITLTLCFAADTG